MENFEALRKDWNSFKNGGGSGSASIGTIPKVYYAGDGNEDWISPIGEPEKKLTPQDFFDLYGETFFQFGGRIQVLVLSDDTIPPYYSNVAPGEWGEMRSYALEYFGKGNEQGSYSLEAPFAGWSLYAPSATDYFRHGSVG